MLRMVFFVFAFVLFVVATLRQAQPEAGRLVSAGLAFLTLAVAPYPL